jgi:hypothetical protein
MSLYLHILETAAVWRITHLLSKEDGPFDIGFIIRRKAVSGFFGSLIDCFYCLSIWIALPFGCWSGNDWKEKLLIWLALSGSACLLEQATARHEQPPSQPHYFEDKN